jgi:hypothetical protein
LFDVESLVGLPEDAVAPGRGANALVLQLGCVSLHFESRTEIVFTFLPTEEDAVGFALLQQLVVLKQLLQFAFFDL